MLSKNKSRHVAVALPAGLCLVLALGNIACCPDGTFPPCQVDGGNGAVTLVNESFAFVPPVRNFNPTAAGRLITATVSGNATGSRIVVIITDLATGSVVAQQVLPTTSSTTVTFVSTNNGVHAVTSTEVGVGAATYTVLVTEQ